MLETKISIYYINLNITVADIDDIDDIITPNVENFLEIAKHIYPIEIPLEQTNNDSLHDTFLDLDITVVNKRFCFKVFHKVDLFDFEVISFPFLESNIPQYICYNTFFSQLVRFSTICSNTSGFAERVHIIYQKLLKRNYDKKKLEKTFNKFTCHYSENLIKYDIPIQKLWQVCLNYNSVTPPSIINKVSFADSNSIFQTNNYIPLRLPISLTNLGNTSYLNSVLQILFQVNTVVPFDIWINHLLLVDKIQCTNSLPLLAFYKFLYLCKLSTISEGELADFVYLLKSINPFFDYKTQRDAHEALILLLDIFSNICNLPLKDNKISTVPEFVDSFFSGIYKTLFVNYAKKQIFTTNPFTILLYNQIQIYFHIWLKISVKIKILLVGNAPFSLVNLYAQVTKKRPICY